MHKKIVLKVLIIFFMSTSICFGQGKKIEIEREYNARSNNYKLVGTNKTNFAYIVDISLYNTNNMSCNRGNNFSVTLKPGRHTIVRINSLNKSRKSSFSYKYGYRPGNINPKPNKKITYLFPVAEGKETIISKLNFLGKTYGKEKEPKGWYNISFSTEEGDTIFTSRAGVVCKVKDNVAVAVKEGAYTYTKDVNVVEVEHEDGTYGVYSVFKNGSIMVKVGDKVIPGQPIGITSGEDYHGGSHLRFSVYHYDIKGNKKKDDTEDTLFEYITPQFLTLQGKDELVIGTSYTSIHDRDIIMDEMSRGEKKKWKKLNPE